MAGRSRPSVSSVARHEHLAAGRCGRHDHLHPERISASTQFTGEENQDYVELPLRNGALLRDGRWVGHELVSVQDPADERRIMNRLYVDDAPFETDGTPRNDFRLPSEYIDRQGQSTGRYDSGQLGRLA